MPFFSLFKRQSTGAQLGPVLGPLTAQQAIAQQANTQAAKSKKQPKTAPSKSRTLGSYLVGGYRGVAAFGRTSSVPTIGVRVTETDASLIGGVIQPNDRLLKIFLGALRQRFRRKVPVEPSLLTSLQSVGVVSTRSRVIPKSTLFRLSIFLATRGEKAQEELSEETLEAFAVWNSQIGFKLPYSFANYQRYFGGNNLNIYGDSLYAGIEPPDPNAGVVPPGTSNVGAVPTGTSNTGTAPTGTGNAGTIPTGTTTPSGTPSTTNPPLNIPNSSQRNSFLEAEVTAAKERMEALGADLEKGAITLDFFADGMRESLEDLYLAVAITASGGLANLTENIATELDESLNNQLDYLDAFVEDLREKIDEGQQDQLKIRFRAGSYANSGRGLYDRVERQSLNDRAAEEEIEERRRLTPADHCDDCVELADSGWQPLGSLPSIGTVACESGCKCYFEYRLKPAEDDGDEEL